MLTCYVYHKCAPGSEEESAPGSEDQDVLKVFCLSFSFFQNDDDDDEDGEHNHDDLCARVCGAP